MLLYTLGFVATLQDFLPWTILCLWKVCCRSGNPFTIAFNSIPLSGIALSRCKTSKPLSNLSGSLYDEFWQLRFLLKVFLGSMKLGSSGFLWIVLVTFILFFCRHFFKENLKVAINFLKSFWWSKFYLHLQFSNVPFLRFPFVFLNSKIFPRSFHSY